MKGRDTGTGWSTKMGWNFRKQQDREQRWKQLPRTIRIMRRLGTCLYVVRERERDPQVRCQSFCLFGFLVFVFCLEKSNNTELHLKI